MWSTSGAEPAGAEGQILSSPVSGPVDFMPSHAPNFAASGHTDTIRGSAWCAT
jgi:hypothetical protein